MQSALSNRPEPGIHNASDLERLFAETFYRRHKTILLGGADEPFYQPADRPSDDNRLYYREDYFASALHEISHWCIAGEARRRLPDFGYWYAPEGRDVGQQQKFEQVEVKPQALEWIFSKACGYPFRLSRDNFSGEAGVSGCFAESVRRAAQAWCRGAIPPRAIVFIGKLTAFYQTPNPLGPECYRHRPQ